MTSSTHRFLALGDSYTIGEGVPEATRWPCVLTDRLRDAGIAIAAPDIVAVTGWTTDELATGMDNAALNPPYDLVSLLIGVNNHYRGRELANYRDEFARLLERAVALAGGRAGRVLGVSIPDWGVTRFARVEERDSARIARELDAFNADAKSQVLDAGGSWADITPTSRQCADRPGMLAADGLHPAAAQYARWVERMTPLVRTILS